VKQKRPSMAFERGTPKEQANAAGGILEMEISNMPYGDRRGGIRDPHGNIWWVSQRLVQTPYSA